MTEHSLPPLPAITEWFGDGEHDFILPADMIFAVQAKCTLQAGFNRPIGLIYQSAVLLEGKFFEHIEVIRHGLIGAGMTPKNAGQLVETYAIREGGERCEALTINIIKNFMKGFMPKDGGGESNGKKTQTVTDGLT